MHTLCISGEGTVAGAAIAALVRECRTDATVLGTNDGLPGPGIRVRLEGSERWIFVGAHGPDAAAVLALSQGACAAIALDSPLSDFQIALRTLVEGGPGYVPLEFVRWMAGNALGRPNAPVHVALTAREREILQLIARGLSNLEIARALTISTNTVRTHLHALSVKLDANGRTRILANARALAIPEALDGPAAPLIPIDRASA